MDKVNAEKETDYRIAMAFVFFLTKQGILSDDEVKQIRNIIIAELHPFIGRLERDM